MTNQNNTPEETMTESVGYYNSEIVAVMFHDGTEQVRHIQGICEEVLSSLVWSNGSKSRAGDEVTVLLADYDMVVGYRNTPRGWEEISYGCALSNDDLAVFGFERTESGMTELDPLDTVTIALNKLGLPFVVKEVDGGIWCSCLQGSKSYLAISYVYGYGYGLYHITPEFLDGKVVDETIVDIQDGIESKYETEVLAYEYGTKLLQE